MGQLDGNSVVYTRCQLRAEPSRHSATAAERGCRCLARPHPRLSRNLCGRCACQRCARCPGQSDMRLPLRSSRQWGQEREAGLPWGPRSMHVVGQRGRASHGSDFQMGTPTIRTTQSGMRAEEHSLGSESTCGKLRQHRAGGMSGTGRGQGPGGVGGSPGLHYIGPCGSC